ncbi:MAG: S-methyl-5-thioribose-1-phosphate isomerase [Bacteroidetes bacterium]|nr:S-methyl-5-thioribose-1-phosphate isomerase [Bacteroidota bacterium]
MHVNGKHYRTLWFENGDVHMIDQTLLPFQFRIFTAHSYEDTCQAITNMKTRGAGAIGAAAGFAMAQAYLQAEQTGNDNIVAIARKEIEETRPTARNLFYAVEKVYEAGKKSVDAALKMAQYIADENVEEALSIGRYGNELIHTGSRIETHCNAGWLGFVDYGSALAPIYLAKESGKKVHVFVDETRPRSQGARLTAWELKNEGISHVIISDNAGAHFMSKGLVDIMIVGADRVAANGDVANKIGTLEKAIVAKQYGIPFYVAMPLSTIDLDCEKGEDITIEERDESEILFQEGPDDTGQITRIWVCNPGSEILNPAFDITPAELITGFITSKGIIKPNKKAINELF